jgi:hypothetical protein
MPKAAAADQPPPPPPPPEYQPAPTYQPPAPPPPSPAAAPMAMKMPPWLDIGIIVIGIGALLIFIGFLFGDGAAGQYASTGSVDTFRGDLEAFFVLTGFGILLTIGGWLFRVVMTLRRGHP